MVGQPQVGAGVGPFAAGDDPHPRRPVLRTEPGRGAGRFGRGRHPGGELGDLRPVARLAVPVDRGPPGLLGDRLDRRPHRLVCGEPDRVLQPQIGDLVQERLGAAAGVGADQHLAALGLGQLGQCGIQDGEVVAAVPRRGPARAQVQSQGLPSAMLAVIDERTHRGEPEAALVGRLSVLLL